MLHHIYTDHLKHVWARPAQVTCNVCPFSENHDMCEHALAEFYQAVGKSVQSQHLDTVRPSCLPPSPPFFIPT